MDGSSYSNQYQAMGGGQGPKSTRLQVGTEEEALSTGQGQETKTDQFSTQVLIHLLNGSPEKYMLQSKNK